MLGRAVVRDDVEQDAQPQRMCEVKHLVELLQGAEERIDTAVVADVVALVHLGRGLERRHPQTVHAE